MHKVAHVGCDIQQASLKTLVVLGCTLLASCARQSSAKDDDPEKAVATSVSLAASAPVSSAAVEQRATPSAVPTPPLPTATSDVRPITTDVKNACETICSHSFALKCAHANDCAVNCLGMATLTPCSAEFVQLYSCLVKEPRAHWECGEDGVASIRVGYCEQQQGAAVGCMEKKLKM